MSLEIRLIGTLEVRRDDQAVPLPPSKKTRALLAYLVATARTHTRGHLCELLWDGPDDPRAALRWSLTKIRPLLDDQGVARVVTDHERILFQPECAAVDLADVRRAIGLDPAPAPTELLIGIAQRFRGEFLEELDLPDCYRYHEWWAAEREALRAMRIAVLSTLVDRLRDNPETALTHARERVLVDPFSEAAHISVIELLGLSGRVREALQQYESCRRMLEGQLGAKPSAALEHARAGLRAIRSVFAPRVSSTPPAAPAPSAANRPLVGRVVEREQIARAIGAARATASREVLWVTGEPGIGKTRLLEDVADQMRATGGLVLSGRSYEAEMVRPYGAWIDALRSTAITVTDAAVSSGLALLLPELGGDAEAKDRYRLFDAVAQLLQALTANGRPLALILDDVHWFDEASAGLLHFVSRALAGSRVLIACAARTAELSDNAAAATLIRALRRDGRLSEISLTRLDAGAIRDLVSTVGPDVDADRVFTESEGNAFFAIEIARALGRGGTSLSDTIEELIADRLDQLDDHARGFVRWAAALGRSFNPDVLRLVSGLAPAELVQAMDELERRGIIHTSPTVAGLYDFTHDLIRRAAYQELSGPRRRIVHLQLARTLATLADPDGMLAGDIAHHAALGGDDELAARAAATAGERSLRLFAYVEAYALADRGMRRVAALARDTRIRLHMALLNIAVRASVAVTAARNLEGEISSVTVDAQQAGLAAEVATGFSLLAFRHHRHDDYAAAFADTLRVAEAGRSADTLTAARALGSTARCLALIEREIPRAESLVLEARDLARDAGVQLIDIPWGLGLVRAFYGEYDEAVRLLETAGSIARAEQDHWAECECLQRLALIEIERGAARAARDRALEMTRVAAKMGEGSEAPFAATLLALAARMLDEPGADDRVEGTIEALRRIDTKALLSRALLIAAALDVDRGELTRAAARAQEALHAATIVGRRSEIAMAHAITARVAHARSDKATASASLSAASDFLRDPHAIAAHARNALHAAECS